MNEQAIQDAYNLFVSQGYRKSIEEFRSLISQNEQALQDVYGLFVDQGYRKSKDDFATLMGLREQPKPQVEEPVKKKDGSELLSEDGSSESAEFVDWENFKPFSFKETPIQPQDTRFDNYRNPMESIGMYPDQATVDRAMRQQAADIKFTQQLQEQEAPALQALQKEEANRQEEVRKRYETERQATIKSPEFETALSATDTKAMEMDEEDAVGYFNNLYGKYGFIFREAGMGDALEVVAPDGTTHDVDLQTFFSNEAEASKLRTFVTSKARKPYETISAEEQDELDLSLRAQQMRKVGRINPDGTESTVLFQSAEVDGKHVVYPTLFPKSASQNYGSHPLFWMELDGNAAYEEALKRGEVFEFTSAEDAQDFAEGSWKNYDNVDGEARKFYNERGLDYVTYKQKRDRLDEVRATIEFLEEGSYYQRDLSQEDKQKYNAYYINGVRRSDAENIIAELNEEASVLRETVNAPEFLTIQEDFDLELQKKFSQRAQEAVQINKQAVQAEDAVQYQSLQTFGVRAEDLRKITPRNEQEKQQIDYLSAVYEDAKALSQEAANKYEIANTYLDSKFDKNLQGQFVENWGAAANAWESGWANGKAGNAILAISLGFEDVNDDTTVEELSMKIVQYMNEAQTGKTSRVETRWHNAKGFEEAWRVFANDPAELAGAFVAQSLSQMLPYGWKIIAGSTATGAGIGATAGLAGGPFAEVTVPAGALVGAEWGFKTGFAATSVALEYTNAVLDAARNQGFNLNDPEQVKQALQTESVWDEGLEIGLKRGIPIALIDMLSAGLAGRVFKTGQLATKGTRVAAGVGERVVFDPLMEGIGEASAMYVAGQELDGKEIAAEMIGGLGNNTPTAALNMYLDSRATNNVLIANNLGDVTTMAAESASDERITSWANNMERLGQISPEQNQRIQENVGLRREARDLLNVGQGRRNFGVSNSSQLEGRLMQLLAAREELSSTPNRQSVFAGKLAEINAEISEIATTKKLRPAEQQTLLAGQGVLSPQEQESGGDIRPGLSKYAINGRLFTKEQFLAEIEKMSSNRLLRANITVDNDEETSNILIEKFDAIQKPSTTEVDAQEQTGDSGTMGEGDTSPTTTTEASTQEELTQPETTEEARVVVPVNEQGQVDDKNVIGDGSFTHKTKRIEAIEGWANSGQVVGVGEDIDAFEERVGTTLSERFGMEGNRQSPNFQRGKLYGGGTSDVKGGFVIVSKSDAVTDEDVIPNRGFQNQDSFETSGGVGVIKPNKRGIENFDLYSVNEDGSLTKRDWNEFKTQPQEEVSSRTQEEQEALDQEVKDLESLFGTEEGPQFQLDSKQTTPERKQALVQSATKLMEQVQPDLVEKTLTFEKPEAAKIYPVTVKENTELANKVRKMGLDELVGKKINLVMADQLKVDENRMGGPFFPLQEGLFGEVAWASISESAAKSIARGAAKADYSVVYNMSPSAIDSNLVTLDTLLDKVRESKNSQELFEAMMRDIAGKKFGPKTDFVQKIAQESQTIEEFAEAFADLDVDTKAAIFRAVLPSENVEASTEVGRMFAAEGISQESIRRENIEQFVSDLPMGAMTMVLQITDKQGNPVTEQTIDEAIITPAEQKERGLKEHRNYPYYLRGKAVGMLSETTPFWNVDKSALSTINAKVTEVVTDAKGKPYTASQARSAEMRRASMQANRAFTVQQPTATAYEQFVTRLSKAFPNVEVVATQEQFNNLLADANAKGLATKNQKIYGAVYQGKLYLNPALENFNTPVHEFGHIWSNVAKSLNPEAYKRGIELIRDSEYIAEVENNPEYQRAIKQMKKDGATDEEIRQYIEEEALATAIGDKGESFATAAQQKNFKNWLNELFEFVKKLTGISKLSPEQLQNVSLDEFLQGVVVDLMSENELFAEAEVNSLSESLQLMTTPSNASITEIVNIGRQRGFSDAAIRAVLKGRGFKASDIDVAMEVNFDLLTPLPREFGNVEGGVVEGKKLFSDVRQKLNEWATAGPRGGRGTTRTKTFGEIRAKGLEMMKNHPIFQAQPEQTQMELLSAFDRSLGIRANANVQREISAIRNNLKQRKIGAKSLRDAQIELKNFIRKNLPKSGIYSQGQINRLISTINNIKTSEDFEAQAEKVLKIVEEQRGKIKRSVLKDMITLVEKKAKAAKTSSNKRRSKGLDAIGQSFFQAIKPIIRAAASNNQEALEKIANSIDQDAVDALIEKAMNGETLTTKERAQLDRALAYDTFADLATMELEDVQQLYEQLKDARTESIARLKSRRLMRAEEMAALRAEAEAEIQEGYGVLFNEDGTLKNTNQLKNDKEAIWESFQKLKVWDGIKKWAARYDFTTVTGLFDAFRNNLAHLGTLANILDKKGKFFTNNVYRALNRMNEVHLQGYYEQTAKLDAMANSIEGITGGYKQFKREMSDDVIKLDGIKDSKTGNAWTQPINQDQAMRIYALYQNSVQREKLIKMGFDADNMQQIEEFIGPRGIQMADMMVDYLSNSYFESVNNVYRQVNDVNLGYVENYFPTQTINEDISKKLIEGDFSGTFNAETAPALKERTDKTSDVELGVNFTDVVETHLQTMEKYKAYAEGVQKLNGIFKSPAIKALLGRYGTDLNKAMVQAINFAVNPDAGMTYKKTFLDRVMTRFTGFALSFKAIQILKQATSFVQAFEDYNYRGEGKKKIPGLDLVMFMIDGAKMVATLPKQIKNAQEVSATFRDRLAKGLEGDVYGLETGSPTFKPLGQKNNLLGKAKRALKKAAGFPTVLGDVLGVMGYMINYNRNIANGMSKAEAAEAFNNYNATQQTRRATEKIPLQMSQHPLKRAFTMFGSTIYLQMNKVAQSSTNMMRSLSDGKMPSAKDTRALALNLAVANVLFAAASNIAKFVEGDDEDKEMALGQMRDALFGMNLIYQIPLLGGGIELAVKRTTGDRSPVSDVVNPYVTVFNKIWKGAKEEDVMKATQPVVEMVLGTQLDPFIGLYNTFGEGFEEENVYDMLGISKSYRPGYGKTGGGSSKEKKGMTKTDMKKYMPELYKEVYGESDATQKEIRAEKNKILKEIRDEAYGDLE